MKFTVKSSNVYPDSLLSRKQLSKIFGGTGDGTDSTDPTRPGYDLDPFQDENGNQTH